MKIRAVSGRTANLQSLDKRRLRRLPGLWPWQKLRLWSIADKNQGRAVADNTTSSAAAHTTWDTVGATATDKEATRSRLGELHRLLNDRKGSLSATCRKNAEANDRAYDMIPKTTRILDGLAEEYTAFEESLKKVMSVHEEADALFAAVTETGELERAQKGPGLVCRTNWIAPAKTWPTAARKFSELLRRTRGNSSRSNCSTCQNRQRISRGLHSPCSP